VARWPVVAARKKIEWTFAGKVLYLNRLKQMMPIIEQKGPSQGRSIGILHASSNIQTKEKEHAMTKSLEVISEAIRNPKHPFRKVDNQPKKPRKHRYERRKIKEYLHLGELVTSEAT
jgi:hypothetical protein